MLAVLSGGGTAGHINPALALADVLSDRGCDVRFAGTPRGVEARLVPAAGVPFTAFEASGFNRNHPTTIVSGVAKIAKSTKAAKKWFREIGPDVVVGFGGYVSIPVARAAESMGIPVVVHEQNSVMGMANRYLAKSAAAVCVTYEGTADGVCDPRIVHVTGNPVRASVLAARREEGRAMLGIPDEARMLLVFGGSLGARHPRPAHPVPLRDRRPPDHQRARVRGGGLRLHAPRCRGDGGRVQGQGARAHRRRRRARRHERGRPRP